MIKTKYPLKRLDWLADLSSGTTPSRAKQEAYFRNGSIPWVKTGDLNNGPILTTDEQITQKAIDECGVKMYPTGTVLVAMYGGFRQIGRTGRLEMPAGINQALCALQISADRGCPQFVQVALNHFVGQWRRFAASSRKDPNITGRDVATFKLPTPRLEMQKAIGSIAGEFGKQLRDGDVLIRRLVRRKSDLMRELLSGRRRFPEFSGSERKNWRLSEVTKRVSRKNTSGVGPVLTVSGQRGLVDQRSFFDSNVSGENLSTYYRITRGEFAYNRSRMNGYPFGAVKSLRSCNSGAVSTLYICFSVNACICDPNYFEQLCEAGMLDSELRKRTQVGGRAHGLLNITLDDFFGIPIQLPKISEQRRIAEVLGLIDQEIALLTKFKTKVEQQKRGVMERLLSGELTIPEDVVERLNLEAEKEEQQRAEDAKLAEATTEDAS